MLWESNDNETDGKCSGRWEGGAVKNRCKPRRFLTVADPGRRRKWRAHLPYFWPGSESWQPPNALTRSSPLAGSDPRNMWQGRIQDFGTEGVQPWRTLSWQSQWGDTKGIAGGECERGLNPLSLGGLGTSPRKFSKFWCFLLQSRHSSALLPGLLIQNY